MKYKIGGVVIPQKFDSMSTEMETFVGQTCIISACEDGEPPIYLIGGFWWPESVLTLAQPSKFDQIIELQNQINITETAILPDWAESVRKDRIESLNSQIVGLFSNSIEYTMQNFHKKVRDLTGYAESKVCCDTQIDGTVRFFARCQGTYRYGKSIEEVIKSVEFNSGADDLPF